MLTDAVEPRPAVRQMDAYSPIYAGIGIALPLATGSPALDARNGQLRGVLGDPAMARRLDPASGAPLAAPDVQGDAQQGVYFPDTRPRPTLPAIRANRFGNGDSTNDDLDLLMSRGTLTAGSLERIGGIAGESAAESLVGGIGEMAGLITRQQRERNVLLNPRRMDAVFEAWAGEAADSGISAYRRGVGLALGVGLASTGLGLGFAPLLLAGRMGAAGFAYGGLTGEGGFDWNRAAAFGLSGAMVGAGLGLMLSGAGGLLSAVGSSTLVGAGTGGYGTFQYDQTVDWRQWGAATLIGGASGAVSGAVGYGMGTSFALARANPWVTNVVTGAVASVAGSATSQTLTYQLLPETRKDFSWNRFQVNLFGAAVGGALGGAITAGLTRGLMHQTGPNAGALRCDVGALNFFSRHFVGGAVGGFVGDAIDQHVGLTYGTKAEREHGWDWNRSFTATVMGGVTGAAGARAAWMMRACFAAGTPIRTPNGWTSIEALQPGDLVLSRDENDPQGRIEAKVVEETFQRTGRVWLLRLEGGVTIRTTPEHPFFPLRTMAWTPAAELRAGDVLRGETGDIRVEAIEDTGVYETVYNCRVADWHTYFVGCDERSVWAHNQYLPDFLSPEDITALANNVRDRSRQQGSNGGKAQAWLKNEYTLPDGQPLSKANRALVLELAKRPAADGTQFNFDGVRGPRTNTMPVEMQTQNRARVAVQGLLEGPEFPQLDPRGGGSRRTTAGGIENLPEQAIPGSGPGVRSPDHTVFGQLTPELAAHLAQRLSQVVQAELGTGPLVGRVRVYGNVMDAPGDFAINIGAVKANGTPTPKEMSQIRSYRASGISVIHISYGISS